METKNSLEVFEQAIQKARMGSFDQELQEKAFYYAVHCFLQGEDFPLERLYEISAPMMFEQIYLYYQKYRCWKAVESKLCQMHDDAGVVLAAAVYCCLEEKSSQQIFCEMQIQNLGQERHLLLLADKCAVYPPLLNLMGIIVYQLKFIEKINTKGLIARIGKHQADNSQEFKLIYSWLDKLSGVEDRAKELLNLIQKVFSTRDPLLELHRENIVKIAADYSAYCKQRACDAAFVKWLAAVLVKADLNNDLRLQLFETYAVDLYCSRIDEADICFEAIAELIADLQEAEYSETLLQAMNAVEPFVPGGEKALDFLVLVEKFWRISVYCRDDSNDFFDDYSWRYVTKVLAQQDNFSDIDVRWLELAVKLAVKSKPGFDFCDMRPLWLALRVLSWKGKIPTSVRKSAKEIFTEQKDNLECFLEERGFDIDWDSWEMFLETLVVDDVKSYVAELLRLLAAYIRSDRDKQAVQQWAESRGLILNDWGSRGVKDDEREALLAVMKVD